MASETVLLAICRPSDSSIVTLLSSLSSLLLTKHLSTRGDGNPAVTRILERRKRSIQLELDFPSYVHETRICDGTEARFIKLSLGSYLSRYRGLTRLEIDNALYFISWYAGWWWCALVIRPLGRWVREKIVTRCSVTETDVATCFPPSLPDNLISRIRLYSYSIHRVCLPWRFKGDEAGLWITLDRNIHTPVSVDRFVWRVDRIFLRFCTRVLFYCFYNINAVFLAIPFKLVETKLSRNIIRSL